MAAIGERIYEPESPNSLGYEVAHEFSIYAYAPFFKASLGNEIVADLDPDEITIVVYDNSAGMVLTANPIQLFGRQETKLDELGIERGQSIFSQLRGSSAVHELKSVGRFYSDIRIYTDWNTSRGSVLRQSQPTDLESHSLLPDAENLTLVLNDMDNRPVVASLLVGELRRFYPRAQAIKTRVAYGRVEASIQEEGLEENVPFSRISDGTLRWLCLLSVLLHPEPPSLTCLEEPEIVLHPDMLRRLATLLVEASERTQLIVTTHSDLLVSALADHPESIVVCEHIGGSTEFSRPNPEHLRDYISRYGLGEAWLKGLIGGTRY